MPLLVGWSKVGVSSVAVLLGMGVSPIGALPRVGVSLLRVGVSPIGALLRVGVVLTLLGRLSPSSSIRTSGLATPVRALALWGRATVNPWELMFCCGSGYSNYVTPNVSMHGTSAWMHAITCHTCM